jgi:hypothetical protein
MGKSTTVLTGKKRGPKPTGKGILVGVRLQPKLFDALDDFIASQPLFPKPTRPSVVREFVEEGLRRAGYLKR